MQKFLMVLGLTTALIAPAQAEMNTTVPELSNGQVLAEVQHLNFWALDNVPTIDPGLAEAADAFDVLNQVFEGLYEQDDSGNTIPALVIDKQLSADKKTYTFTIRDDATWTDGKPVTAHDFVYAWQRVANPETASGYAYYIAMMGVKNAQEIIDGKADPETLGAVALDDFTLQVELNDPKPYLTTMLTHGTTYPVPRWAIEQHGDAWTAPENIVSNGAYLWVENKVGEEYTVERNPNYWNDANTIVDSVTWKVIPDENQAFLRYQAGELDHTAVPTGQYPRIKAQMPDEVYDLPNMCVYYLAPNQRENGPEAFKDWRVRRALSMAIDRQFLVERVLVGQDVPTWTFTHGMTAGFTPPFIDYWEWEQSKLDAEAKRLMEEAGYGPDNPLEFTYSYNTSEGHKKIAIYLSQIWKQKLGANVTLENMEWKTFLEVRARGEYDMARHGWCSDYNEPSTWLDLLHSGSSQNDTKHSDPTIDKLLEDSKSMDDPAAIYTTVEALNADKAYVIPLYDYVSEYLIAPKVGGWPLGNAEQKYYFKNFYVVEE